MNRLKRLIVGVAAFALIFAAPPLLADETTQADAHSITLEWDAPASSIVKGYRLQLGVEPGVYNQTIDVGSVSTYTIALSNAETHYITVVSLGDNGVGELIPISPPSNEVAWSWQQAPKIKIGSITLNDVTVIMNGSGK